MRKLLALLALFLVGCSSDGAGPIYVPDAGQAAAQPPTQHALDITNVALTPDTVNHMEGNGNIVVAAEITFEDDDSDVKTLWAEMPDGTTVEFNVVDQRENQSITVDFDISTDKVGMPYVSFWLVDEAGNHSESWGSVLRIVWDGEISGWTKRLGDVPYGFWDVVWDGTVFVAVGDDGAILTSSDGVDWVKKESGVETTLVAVAAFGPDIVAVGDEIVLLSTDHGDTWTVKYTLDLTAFEAVALNATQYVVGGMGFGQFTSPIILSEDRGETWEVVDEGAGDFPIRHFACGDGLFVATTWQSSAHGGRVKVSADGREWNEVFVSEGDETAYFAMVFHDGSQFVVAGYSGISMSLDGLNWTRKQAPLLNFDYQSAASNGSKLLLAGAFGSSIMGGHDLQSHWPAGIASTDGGLTWEFFGIDEGYLSHSMAFGNGRFVSVGRAGSNWLDNEGAIYTSD